jgi:protein required for attachment to host cells
VDNGALLAAISGAGAVTVAAVTAGLTYLFTKHREREADWRKMKLDLYKEYVAALSGIVEGRDTPEGHIRYADAVNSLTLVASPQVLKALYAYLDYTISRNTDKSRESHDEFLTGLVKTLRRDVYPSDRYARDPFQFRLTTVPPHMRISREAAQQN